MGRHSGMIADGYKRWDEPIPDRIREDLSTGDKTRGAPMVLDHAKRFSFIYLVVIGIIVMLILMRLGVFGPENEDSEGLSNADPEGHSKAEPEEISKAEPEEISKAESDELSKA